MLQTQNLSYQYPGQQPIIFPDLSCSGGEQLLVLGTSGSGKTTLLHLLAGLLPPKEGSVIVNEQNLHQLAGASLDRFRGKNIGIVFQQAHFVQALTAMENLLLTQQLASGKTDKSRAEELARRLQITHRLKARPNAMSQGEQQRLSIARALINKPRVLLADEPTSALDDENCHQVADLLQEQAAQEQAALIIVTHDSRLKQQTSRQLSLEKISV